MGRNTAFTVAVAQEPQVLARASPDSTWAWRLTDDAGRTRLVTRLKARNQPGPFSAAWRHVGRPLCCDVSVHGCGGWQR
jgi:hypothetical protein